MKETEFKALLSLLDDEDPGVATHVEGTLLSMGDEVIPRLEYEWEVQNSELIQSRIEDIIHIIQSSSVVEELRDWMDAEEKKISEGWFLVTKYMYPGLDYQQYKNELNRLTNRIWLDFLPNHRLHDRISVINRMLFNQERFAANKKTLFDEDSYYMHKLLEGKKGSPLGMSLLYLSLSRELDIPLKPVLLPNYCVLLYRDERNEFYVDVFNEGALFLRKDLQKFLKRENIPDKPAYYEPSTDEALINELILSLIRAFHFNKRGDKSRVLENLRDKVNS